jgi:asparagine synthase (glutamine-hydrolysing)
MFAFAIWDAEERILFMARDRFGEKPLYFHYDHIHGELHFASEGKALAAAGLTRKPDLEMVFQYLTLGTPYMQGDAGRSFYEGIYQLSPASHLTYETGKRRIEIERYWDLDKAAVLNFSAQEACSRFRELLDLSIQRRLRSDVPVGTSLSGGLDSSSVLASCKNQAGNSYAHHSFSAVFPGFAKDESDAILQIARHFSINPTLTEPGSEGLLQHIGSVVRHQEMPPTSASVFAQYSVYASVSETDVKVLLDGQGADETLGGYGNYAHYFLQELYAQRKYGSFRKEKRLLQENGFLTGWGPLNVLAAWMPELAAQRLEHRAHARQQHHPDLQRSFIKTFDTTRPTKPIVATLNDILYNDTMQGRLQELLHYADRNSMAFGREVRLPFLSHELVEFVFALPSSMKMKDGYTKWILRSSQQDRLPPDITWRKGKIGFEPPQRQWMENNAVQASILSAKKKLHDLGILNDQALSRKIQPHDAYAADGMDWRYWMVGLLI